MRRPLPIPGTSAEELKALDPRSRTARVVRARTRAQTVLLAVEQRLAAPTIAAVVREDAETVRCRPERRR